MANVFDETFDSIAVGANINAVNTSFDNLSLGAGGTLTAISGGIHGIAARVTSTSAGSNLREDWLAPASERYVRFYVRISANPPNQMGVVSIRSSTTIRANIQISTTGHIRMRDGSILETTSANPLTLDEWARIEWHWDAANTTQAIRIFKGANVEHPTSYDEQLTGDAGLVSPGTADNTAVGILDATTSGLLDFDNYAVDDAAWPGPTIENNATVGWFST